MVGDFTIFDGVTRNRITRLDAVGKTDPNINFGEGANSFIATALVQPDRKIVIAGGFTSVQGKPRNRLARLNGGSSAGPGRLEFSAPFYTVLENQLEAVITVRRVEGTTKELTVDYSTLESFVNPATDQVDYQSVTGQLVFAEGEVQRSFTIPIIDDVIIEADEFIDIELTNPTQGAELGSIPYTTLVLLSDDSLVSFLTSTNVVTENEVAGRKEIFVVRSGTTNGSVSVNYLSQAGTATAGTDYSNVTDTLTFLPGESVKSFFVPIINDTQPELIETVQLSLTNITSGGQFGIAASTLLIVDDDFTPGRFQFSAVNYVVNEYETNIVITVLRTNGTAGIVTVEYETISGSAQAGQDFVLTKGALSFPDGEAVRTFSIPIIPDYNNTETNETVILSLTKPSGGATLGTPNSATLTILNNNLINGAFSFFPTNYSVLESGLLTNLTVVRSFGATGAVSVSYRTVPGTARAGSDFVPVTNTLTWANGDATPKSFAVTLVDDAIVEAGETFAVELSGATGGAVVGARPQAVVTVVDNDVGPGFLSLGAAAYFVDESGTNALITVNRTFGFTGTVSAQVATVAGGSARAGVDYGVVITNLVFLQGETNKTFLIGITNNFIVEGNKTVNLVLSNPLGGAQTNGQIVAALLTIIEDEQQAGSVDAGFINGGANLPVNVIVVQTNNDKMLVGGDFTLFSGQPRSHILRLNLSGSVDATFDPGTSISETGSTVRALAVQPNGMVLAGGYFNQGSNFLFRFTVDGARDDTNFLFGLSGPDNFVNAIALQSDSKIVIAGAFTAVNGAQRGRVARLDFTGAHDLDFDPGEGANGEIHAAALQADGFIVLGGDFTAFDGQPFSRIVRLDGQGQVDPLFTSGAGFDGSVRSIAVQPDGKLVVGGYFTNYDGTVRAGVARLNTDGSLDTGFDPGTGANELVTSVALQTDGKIVVGGAFTVFNGIARNRLVRLSPDGSVDYTINFGTGANNFINTIAIQRDRKIVIGGGFTEFDGAPRNYIARLAGGDNYGSGEFAFSATNYPALEKSELVNVTVRRLIGSSNAVSVAFATADGTASSAHYVPTNGVLNFAPGETVASFDVQLINDIAVNADRTILVALSNPTGGSTLGLPNQSVITIVNDDASLGFSVEAYSITEVLGDALITVQRTGSTVGSVLVQYSTTTTGTATAGTDYVAVPSTTLVLTNGQSQASFLVRIQDDALTEGIETVGLLLSGGTTLAPADNLFLDRSAATLFIIDDETGVGTIGFSSTNYTASERGGLASITVVRQGGRAGVASVDFASSVPLTGINKATPGVDYFGTNGTVTFGDGQTVKTFQVALLDDTDREPAESIQLTLSNPVGAQLGLSNATLFIEEDQALFSFATNTFFVDETNGTLLVTVLRSTNGTGPVSVDFATEDLVALAGLDYLATNGTLNFAPGQFTNTFSVVILDDIIGEGTEVFTLRLTNPGGESATTPGGDAATVAILDGDTSFSFDRPEYFVDEAVSPAQITILRIGGTNTLVSVRFVASDGTAKAGTNFVFTSQVVVFNPGETFKNVFVPILNSPLAEGDLTANLSLLNPTNGTTLGVTNTALLTIRDDEVTFSFSAPTYTFSENVTNAVVTVLRTGGLNSSATFSVQFGMTNGSALAGQDYTNVTGQLTFNLFETAKTIIIPIVNDPVIELDETFSIGLFNPSSSLGPVGVGLRSPRTTVITIVEDDASISLTAATLSVSESASNAVFTVFRTGTTNTVVSVNAFTTNGTAQAGVDYTGTNALVVFQPGESSHTITIPILDDMIIEGNEAFTLQLASPSNTVFGAFSLTTVTILDNDASTIIAAGAALVGELPGPTNGLFDPGETVTVNIGLRNIGNVPTANLVATLLATNGVTSPSAAQTYGIVREIGNTVSRPFSFVVSGTNGGRITATLRLQDGANNLGLVTFQFTIGRASSSFVNATGITINDQATASPYPSVNIVSGAVGTVTKITVSLNNVTHGYPDDLDVLLVGPGGQRVMLMSDAGSSASAKNPLNNVTITFDELAANPLPDSNQIVTATYRPANYAGGMFTADSFEGLLPPFTNTSLGVFIGTIPNGTWALYVVDDEFQDVGNIAGGWTLNVTTTDTALPPADLSVYGVSTPNPLMSGDVLTYSVRVTNHGPATATSVMLTNTLPPGVTFQSASSTAGSCVNAGSLVTCSLGTLVNGAFAIVTITTTATTTGNIGEISSVLAATPDVNLDNNVHEIKTAVQPLALSLALSGQQTILRWRAPATGYTLQQVTGLGAASWQNVTTPPTVVNGSNTVVLGRTNAVRFFRLLAP